MQLILVPLCRDEESEEESEDAEEAAAAAAAVAEMPPSAKRRRVSTDGGPPAPAFPRPPIGIGAAGATAALKAAAEERAAPAADPWLALNRKMHKTESGADSQSSSDEDDSDSSDGSSAGSDEAEPSGGGVETVSLAELQRLRALPSVANVGSDDDDDDDDHDDREDEGEGDDDESSSEEGAVGGEKIRFEDSYGSDLDEEDSSDEDSFLAKMWRQKHQPAATPAATEAEEASDDGSDESSDEGSDGDSGDESDDAESGEDAEKAFSAAMFARMQEQGLVGMGAEDEDDEDSEESEDSEGEGEEDEQEQEQEEEEEAQDEDMIRQAYRELCAAPPILVWIARSESHGLGLGTARIRQTKRWRNTSRCWRRPTPTRRAARRALPLLPAMVSRAPRIHRSRQIQKTTRREKWVRSWTWRRWLGKSWSRQRWRVTRGHNGRCAGWRGQGRARLPRLRSPESGRSRGRAASLGRRSDGSGAGSRLWRRDACAHGG